MTPRAARSTATVLAGAATVLLVRRLRARSTGGTGSPAEPRSRWHAVTVNRSAEEVLPGGQVPRPLAELGDLVEVEVRAAPGDKGSELRARLRQPRPEGAASGSARVAGEDPRQRVRAALREAKQLIEAGEVLRVDPVPHGRRKPTPTGKLVEVATARAGGEGLS